MTAQPAEQLHAALSIRGLSKTFPGTHALDNVSFDVAHGSIHALLGGNGSGKSTLIKILAGVQPADTGGSVTLDGTDIDVAGTGSASSRGLAVVHQNLGLFPELTVGENLCIGDRFETGAAGRIKWRAVRDRARRILDEVGLAEVSPTTPLAQLRPADQTMVAIARALLGGSRNAALLVLDEPTTSLPPHEVEELLTRLKVMAATGQAILYVTHRLGEVLEIADTVSVLRDGRHHVTRSAEGLDESTLVELIVGSMEASATEHHTSVHDDGSVVLEVRDLVGGPLRGANLKLRAGEIVGLAGLLGSGRTELLRMCFGDLQPISGEVLLDGATVRFDTVKAAMKAGMAMVPEDRTRDAGFSDLDVRSNLSAGRVDSFWSFPLLRHRAEAGAARTDIAKYKIKTPSDRQEFVYLSGGNQQKVIMARWLGRDPRVLLLDEPSQGVDIGARHQIHNAIRAAAATGAAVLMVSSDFEELVSIADRVAVLAEGRVVKELPAASADPAHLAELSFQTHSSTPSIPSKGTS